jgi:DNA-binding response OmpR family regulator
MPHLNVTDCISGHKKAQLEMLELILLDLMPLNISGFDICKVSRKDDKTSALSIGILTDKREEIDQFVGFEVGPMIKW